MRTEPRFAIVGVGETEFKRGHPLSLDALVIQASRRAVAGARLSPAQIDGVMTTDAHPPHDEIALGVAMADRRFSAINPLIPGAGPVAAIIQAQLAISAGLATSVLIAYGTQTSKPGGPYAYHAADPLKADLEM